MTERLGSSPGGFAGMVGDVERESPSRSISTCALRTRMSTGDFDKGVCVTYSVTEGNSSTCDFPSEADFSGEGP